MKKYYGYISTYKHALADNKDKVFIITKACNTKEEAETEYNKIYNEFDRKMQIDFWGRNKGVMAIEEQKQLFIPANKWGIIIDIV